MGASAKGIFVAGAVASVRKAIRQGRVAREQVEIRLDSQDVAFLDEKVDVGLWYPISTLGHFLDVLADLQDGDREVALTNIGRAAADMAAQTGRYAQLDTKRKAGDSPTEVLRYGRLITSVITAFYDFSHMSFGPDPNDASAFQIDWFDVGDLPESNRFAAQGFIERIAHYASHSDPVVRSSRPTPDHIVFSIRDA
jgi:hypothetical protein